jgi:hypothetical protein
MDNRGLEKKYRSLKRKYKNLETEAVGLSDEVTKAKKRIIRLQKERSFLLDRLLKYERVSSDSEPSDSSPESSSSEEERPVRRTKKEKGERSGRSSEKANGHSRRKPKDKDNEKEEGIQLCIARGKDDRPCKSKALANFQYCWHHAPLDPNSPFIFCQYHDPSKRNAKKCNIPVAKSKAEPYCNYHINLMVPTKTETENEHEHEQEHVQEHGQAHGHENENGETEEIEVDGEETSPVGEETFDASSSGDDGSRSSEGNIVI